MRKYDCCRTQHTRYTIEVCCDKMMAGIRRQTRRRTDNDRQGREERENAKARSMVIMKTRILACSRIFPHNIQAYSRIFNMELKQPQTFGVKFKLIQGSINVNLSICKN